MVKYPSDPCPPWWDKFEEELEKIDPNFGRYCAMISNNEIEARKQYVRWERILYEKYGIERDYLRINAPLSAVRSLLKLDLNGETASKASGTIAKALKDTGMAISKKHVESLLGYKKREIYKPVIDPKTIRIPISPQIALTNAPINGRKELLNQFYKLAGTSIGIYEELAKRNDLEDEYAAFIAGCVIIQKYLDGEIK